jgi:hypothetical protein
LNDPLLLFRTLNNGDVQAANDDYMAFLGANIMSGNVRFYSPSPLSTPLGFQITTGDCARAPNIDVINASYEFIEAGFADYVRFAGANTVCGDPVTHNASRFTAQMQGFDVNEGAPENREQINAWLWLEFDLITKAAGWYEGMSVEHRGTPRPPLCHVSQ